MTFNEAEIFDRILGRVPFDYIDAYSLNDDTCEIDAFYSNIPDDCVIKTGASKIVIVPDDKNYVIKIPFHVTNTLNYSYYSKICTDGHRTVVPDYEHGSYEELCNAPYRLTNEFGWDYCRAEEEMYQIAKEEHFEQFFAATQYIGEISEDFPIYVQEKAQVFEQASHSHSKLENDNTRKSLGNEYSASRLYSIDFVTDALHYYGENRTRNFLRFISENDINDLHSANIGYIGHRPVLIDYSSFDN